MLNKVYNSSLNQRNETEEQDKDSLLDQWIVTTTLSAACCIFVTYLTVALTVHAKKRKLIFCQDTSAGKHRPGPQLLSSLTILGCLAEIVYFVVGFIPLHYYGEPFCAVGQKITICCGVIVLGCVYFGLWFRLYSIFYHNQLIKKNLHKSVRFISKLSFGFYVIMLVTNAIVFLWAPSYKTTSNGCLKVEKKGSSTVKWSLMVSSTVIFQATFLFLFIYPLWLHRKNNLHQGFDSKRIIPIIKRVLVTSLICIISDAANAVFALTIKNPYWYIRHTVYGINILINLLALICSFMDWKVRLFPFLRRRRLLRGTTRNQTFQSRLTTISGSSRKL